MEEWAKEKIQQNKGFLVERLTSEDKWNENCLSLNVPLCVVTFLPNILDSSEEERKVYLEIIKGVHHYLRRLSTTSEKNQSVSFGHKLETTPNFKTNSLSTLASPQFSSSTRSAESFQS